MLADFNFCQILFNIYTHDLPETIAKKFAYADDLAIMHRAENWQELEGL